MCSDAPAAAEWVTIEEHGCCLEEEGRGLIETEGFPKAGVDCLRSGDTIAWQVAVVGGSIETCAWSTDITWSRGNESVLACR